jgi:hypothetical protein
MALLQIEIGRDKLRAAIRKLPHEYVFLFYGQPALFVPEGRSELSARQWRSGTANSPRARGRPRRLHIGVDLKRDAI